MDYDALIKSIRKSIFYRLVGSLGNAVFLTGSALQLDIVNTLWPLSTLLRFWLVGIVMLTGALVQIIGWHIADKAQRFPGISVWLKSYSEIKRQLVFSQIIIVIALFWILGLMYLGSSERYRIDYSVLLAVFLCSLTWVMFFADLLLPRKLPKREEV
ncbi:hypothetical protein MMA231_03187 [Asticcacaulis sp. MM231]|uniref:hypothetical protein n=1 Tax=Asticcacaulis sp. MM231 TaxID=3157666 RepID=UPI0032D59780